MKEEYNESDMRKLKQVMGKIRYVAKVVTGSLLNKNNTLCPFCGSAETTAVSQKLFVIKLLRCDQCKLMFRWPKSDCTQKDYYDSCYDEPRVTALPSGSEIEELRRTNFKKSIYNIEDKIAYIKKYIEKGIILDYGSSWGYHTQQFVIAGFSCLGFDIARKRAIFGRVNLHLTIIDNPKDLESFGQSFDLIFANNVLEHIGEIGSAFDLFYRLLKRNGYLYIIVPDCSNIDTEPWRKIYVFGEKHNIAFDSKFFQLNLPALGFTILEIKEENPDTNSLMVFAQKR